MELSVHSSTENFDIIIQPSAALRENLSNFRIKQCDLSKKIPWLYKYLKVKLLKYKVVQEQVAQVQ